MCGEERLYQCVDVRARAHVFVLVYACVRARVCARVCRRVFPVHNNIQPRLKISVEISLVLN